MVPPGDVDALIEAVVRLLEDEPRRRSIGAAARRVAEERYSWDTIGRRLLDVYGMVIDGRPSVPAPLRAATA
jgi:glycosyltransferase involved in cell wall biosynthesis